MAKNIILIFSILIIIAFSKCCDNGIIDPIEELIKPELTSSIPANGASDVDMNISSIELVFKDKISIVSKSRFILNDTEVADAVAEDKRIIISLTSLNAETTYTLIIEALAIKASGGAVNSEDISISFTTGEEQEIDITNALAVAYPSTEVTNLYTYLKNNYGKKIISSSIANVSWNTNEAEWVKLHTGKYPAINTFDYIHLPYSPANWIDYSDISVVEDWWENNGIVSACWHWLVPTSNGASEYTYKPAETNFDPSKATTEGTWENNVVKADLEKISEYLLLIKDKNIPVIWRPLHEASGNIYKYTNGEAWFWWGIGGAEVYKDLWIYMFEYFEHKGLNNLIWVWTTQIDDDPFYPGDEYVDIIGRDIYDKLNAPEVAIEFAKIQNTYPSKMVTLSECGNVATISTQWSTNANWSYFMPWYDYDRTNNTGESDFSETDHIYANAEWWIDAVNQDVVITRDELPSLK